MEFSKAPIPLIEADPNGFDHDVILDSRAIFIKNEVIMKCTENFSVLFSLFAPKLMIHLFCSNRSIGRSGSSLIAEAAAAMPSRAERRAFTQLDLNQDFLYHPSPSSSICMSDRLHFHFHIECGYLLFKIVLPFYATFIPKSRTYLCMKILHFLHNPRCPKSIARNERPRTSGDRVERYRRCSCSPCIQRFEKWG